MARIDLTELITAEYADERRLDVRFRTFREYHSDPRPETEVLDIVASFKPGTVLEVGCGGGAFSESVAKLTGAQVTAVDQSARMAGLASLRGLNGVVADVQSLPFPDRSFDLVIANWMLYHLPDLHRGLDQLQRVLRPGGHLVAVTMASRMMGELWSQVHDDGSTPELTFSSENCAEELACHFASVERRDLVGTATFPDYAAAISYMESTLTRAHLAPQLPRFEGPLEVSTHNVVFIAER
ncbi:MAG: class I SAM-dependent methyltransferase [Thermoleophilia bacterium]|nr:class I SAM-dependent methyltransferase [Thermoleophilia bacterium]